ncbi:MAG: hypothetical protein HYY24_10785 [Verrucomicrobia bacterium]|nr:hypothetical protein [Verrucomicrobiota bacterium]
MLGEIVTASFRGFVTSVSSPSGAIHSSVGPGTAFWGLFTFNTTNGGSGFSTGGYSVRVYEFDGGTGGDILTIRVGDYAFSSPRFIFSLVDNRPPNASEGVPEGDELTVFSSGARFVGDLHVEQMFFALSTTNRSVLSGTGLPTAGLPVPAFETRELTIAGEALGEDWSISGQVEAVEIPTAPPALAVGRSGEALVISWPAPYTDYVLEERAAVSSVETWKKSDQFPVLDSGEKRVRLMPQAQARFFRLRRL